LRGFFYLPSDSVIIDLPGTIKYRARAHLAMSFTCLGGLANGEGEHERAVRLLAAADALFEQMGAGQNPENRATGREFINPSIGSTVDQHGRMSAVEI